MNSMKQPKPAPRPVEVFPKGDLEIVMTRQFHAPRQHVFDAWTKPELLRQWLGVRGGWTMSVCEIDLRVGGAYRYVWHKASTGAELAMGGVYREIVPPRRIVNAETFDDPWYEGQCLVTLELDEKSGVTTCTLTARYDSVEIRDGILATPMATGVEESYAVLDSLLAVRTPDGFAGVRPAATED